MAGSMGSGRLSTGEEVQMQAVGIGNRCSAAVLEAVTQWGRSDITWAGLCDSAQTTAS